METIVTKGVARGRPGVPVTPPPPSFPFVVHTAFHKKTVSLTSSETRIE